MREKFSANTARTELPKYVALGDTRFAPRIRLARLEWRSRHRRAGRFTAPVHSAGNDDLVIDLRDALIPLCVTLPTEHDFKAMRETLGGMLHEP